MEIKIDCRIEDGLQGCWFSLLKDLDVPDGEWSNMNEIQRYEIVREFILD